MGLGHCPGLGPTWAQGWGPNAGTPGPELLGTGVQGARRERLGGSLIRG